MYWLEHSQKHSVFIMLFIFLSTVFSTTTFSAENQPARSKTLTITNSNNWAPMSFLDDDDKPQGILIDLWKEIGKRENLNIEFKLVDWSPSLQLIADGDADIHAGLMYSEKREEYLDFTIPLEVPNATRLIVSRKLNIANMEEIGEIPVCVVDGAYAIDFIKANYQAVQLIHKENSKACVSAAISGEVLAFTLDYSSAMYFLHQAGKPDHFYVADTLYSQRLRAAVTKGNTELLNRINDALTRLPKDEYTRIIQKWLQVEPAIPQWIYPTIISGVLFLFIAFALFYISTLKSQVEKRTRELQALSQTDSLTKLHNRPRIEHLFIDELQKYQKHTLPFSVIIIDIDNFKTINDNYGHTKGDDVLISFAALLRDNIRKSDHVGRWGGEEFLIICPNTTQQEANKIAENLRGKIENDPNTNKLKLTASFGITQVTALDNSRDVFIRADKALYQAKETGRNRVVTYEEKS